MAMKPLETANLLAEESPRRRCRKHGHLLSIAFAIICVVAVVAILRIADHNGPVANHPEVSLNSANNPSPNIIYILMDDLGFTDTVSYLVALSLSIPIPSPSLSTCCSLSLSQPYYSNYVSGNNYSFTTPNMRRFASDGIKLNWHYSEPVCSPSRSALYVILSAFPPLFLWHHVFESRCLSNQIVGAISMANWSAFHQL